jgi:hypothetical protein
MVTGEQLNEWAYVYGRERTDHEWLISDYDTYHHNPHFAGCRGSQQHPMDDSDGYHYYYPCAHVYQFYCEVAAYEAAVAKASIRLTLETLVDDIPF